MVTVRYDQNASGDNVVVTPGGEVLIIYRGTLSTRGTGGVRLELRQGKAFAEYEEFNKK